MVYRDLLLPLPIKKVIRKERKQGTYIYFTTRAFRNKNGKPDSEQRCIGILDKATGLLNPNSNYFELFPKNKPKNLTTDLTSVKQRVKKSESRKYLQSKSHGESIVLYEMSRQTGLLEILQKCFPEKWDQIIGTSSYMVSKGNVISYIGDWFHQSDVHYIKKLDGSTCSRLFESITEEDRRLFFKHWSNHHDENEFIVFDVTSLSTYAKNISIAEWGYNRDNDNIPQLNLGMYYGMSLKIPIYYKLYNGSIPDKSYFEFMLRNSMELDINKACFVFDGGFVTNDNISFSIDNQFSVLSVLSSKSEEAKKIIDKVKNSIEKSSNWVEGMNGYGVKEEITLYGHKIQAHIYLDLERKYVETVDIRSRIIKLEDELKKMNNSKSIPTRFNKYFKVDKPTKNKISYEQDMDKIDELISRAGFYILLTIGVDLNNHETLKIYREKDVIEKNFDQLKNDLDFKRLKTHWTKTTEGKIFVGFIALIMRNNMLQLLKSNEQTKDYTFKTVQIELNKIQSAVYSDGTKELAPITKKQREILNALKVDIRSYINDAD